MRDGKPLFEAATGLADTHSGIPGVATYSWSIAEDRISWSPGLLSIYGLDAAPDDERGFIALVHPEDRVRVEAETSAFLESGESYAHEFRIVRPDGEVRVIHDRGTIERDASGTAVALHGINVDVTAERPAAAEEGAEPTLESFRRLADNIDQLAWIADGSGAIFWYNRRWFDFTGTTLEEMAGWGWTAVHHPDHVDRVVRRIRRSFETGVPWEDTFPLRGRDGRYRWFLSRAKPVRDAAGRVRHWYGTNTDITDTLAAEERLKHSEERFRVMADSMPHLVWCATSAGDVTYYNRQARHFAPVRDRDTGAFDWTLLVHADDLERTRERWTGATEEETEFSIEHRLRMADGGYRWHLSRAAPVRQGPEGEIVWYGTATDIHALKALERHKALLAEELGHRMKNTLSLVQSMANRTFRRLDGDKAAVAAFGERLRALAGAHDILVRQDWSEVTVGEICESTLGPLGVAGKVSCAGAALTASPRVGVLLSLALHELATNAIKYGALSAPGGRATLSWDSDPDREAGFRMAWRESGGPPVTPPESEGFGSRLLKVALAAEIDGRVDLDYAPAGLVCEIAGRLR